MERKRLEDMNELELSTLMIGAAKAVELYIRDYSVCDPRPMFALLVFNDPKVAQFISTCERPTMIEALREAADRIERNQHIER